MRELDFFMNDRMKVLQIINQHQICVEGNSFCPLNQQEIADLVPCSKLKANQIIRELIDEKIIDENKIEFCYAGNDAAFFLQQARLYKLEDRVKNYNNISRIDCLKLQFNSDFLLLSTWNNKKEFGVFPGKLLEYMLINKPILWALVKRN